MLFKKIISIAFIATCFNYLCSLVISCTIIVVSFPLKFVRVDSRKRTSPAVSSKFIRLLKDTDIRTLHQTKPTQPPTAPKGPRVSRSCRSKSSGSRDRGIVKIRRIEEFRNQDEPSSLEDPGLVKFLDLRVFDPGDSASTVNRLDSGLTVKNS